MARQWIRKVKLTLGDGGEEMDLSALRIRFQVRQFDLQTPNWAEITVSNPAPNTVDKAKKEYTKVTLQAGYAENFATIFEGEIRQIRYGRENPTDTYLTILGTDGGRAHNYSVVNRTLAAGSTFRQQVDAALEPMKAMGIKVGYIADLGSAKMPRGVVLFGMARDILRNIAQATNTSWSIQNGEFQMIKNDESRPGDAIVVNSRTGMIGLPTQTLDGIEVRTLLNPQFKIGSIIQIDQASVQDAPLGPSIPDEVKNSMIPSTADDGFYKVYVVDHAGDSRGNPYFTDLVCIRADGKGIIPAAISQRGVVLDPNAR
ncbi:hypothetical protein C3941_19815 [Kaistia algarum]|uniref:phage protein n=1 Tax=Kaistia algarum TaxID=2083279 RepID=UPI000CE91D64|nr:hypothetical protein [Kaistia algarum]MCX5516240.1 hypothetical protein [Kaistia algarum]PPE78311.1 hypothetical protein C3941_19815 [Kaistia algarum]